ncbi:MAG: hypothetical protein ACYTGW_12485, partial [Planctomycetota bacterium]
INPGEPGESTIQRMVAQGVAVDGRPRVQNVFPSGNGWAGTVPIVVEFNETINEASVAPQTGAPNLFLQVEGTSTALPAVYDFLFGSRVVVIRPAAALGGGEEIITYEVVVTPELRDGDGVRFGGSENKVVGSFTPDQDSSVDDGEIVTILPLDNSTSQRRESIVYAVFSKPVDQTSVKTGATGNFNVREKGGSIVAGSVSYPVGAGPIGGGDARILAFTSTDVLAGDVEHEIVVDDTITFGGGAGKLDFNNRTPFARFKTLAFEDVDSVTVGNATANFPDQVNTSNLADLMIDVDLPVTAAIGDRVTVRIYGLDPDDPSGSLIRFVEAGADLVMPGDQVLTISFMGKLGTVADPEFSEGALTIAAQVSRSSSRTGFVLADADNRPRLDVTPPTLSQVGPPTGPDSSDFVTDQEHAVFVGQADEGLGAASLTDGSTTVDAYALANDGRFMLKPLFLARRTSPLPYTLTLTDDSGNASTPITGNIIQRGVITDNVASTTLVVEAYDEATFLPLSGVTVLIDEGMPQKPASGRQTQTTDMTGRATFTGLTATSSYSVTLVNSGYHLISVLDTPARFVSLPMRPQTGATASLTGTQSFQAVAGQTLLAGCNIIDDVLQESIPSTTTTPTVLVPTPVRPNRPYVLTAFSGVFEPQSLPAFNNYACLICGPTGLVATPAATAIAPDATATTNQTLIPSIVAARNLAAAYTKDFADSTGLNTGALAGTPTVRVQTSLFGFGGMTTFGVGQATPGAGASFAIDATYLVTAATLVLDLGPKLWVSTEATDSAGNVARHRRIIIDPILGTTVAAVATPGIPTISAPAAASTGAPAVEFQDRLDPADIPVLGFGMQTLTATDKNGRIWRVLREDTNAKVGSTTWQLPVFSTPAGLAPGSGTDGWTIRAESVLLFSLSFSTGDIVLEETRREEVTYARAAAETFDVQ